MSQLVPTANLGLVSTMLSESALRTMTEAFDSADNSLGGSNIGSLSFRGRSFYIKQNGNLMEVNPDGSRLTDIIIVGYADNDHVSFYEKSWEESNGEFEPESTFTRYMRPNDPKTNDWKTGNRVEGGKVYASRGRKRRAIVLLANDPSCTPYIADFGELSLYAPRDTNLQLFSFVQLVQQFKAMRAANAQLFPFMFLVQMSFTADTVPVVQFSFQNQLNKDPSNPYRLAGEAHIKKAIEMWNSGEVQRLLDMWIEPADSTPALTHQPAPVAQPVVQQLAVQPVAQPMVQPMAQPVAQPVVQPTPVQPTVQVMASL